MSITLTTGVLVAINGVTVENDLAGAVRGMVIDYLSNTVIFDLIQGNVAGANFSRGTYGSSVNVTVNMTTGAWTSSNGLSGTLAGAAFTNAVSQLKGLRNLMETFASSNIMPGVQVAW